jgi:TetR/AcrR family transcriptional regulator, tetracycline repressor protein
VTARRDRSGPRRRTLTREQVLSAALAIVDAEGLDALTMRRLASDLGVEAMSLYTHVRDKQDLIDGVNGLVLAQLDRPTDAVAWPDALMEFARRLYEAYLPRPELARVLQRSTSVGPEALGAMERVLAVLAESGLAPSEQVSGFRGVIAACLGFVQVHTGLPVTAAPGQPWAAWDDPASMASALPHVVQLAPAFETTAPDDDFEFVIGACIEALRAKSAARRTPGRRATAPE